LSKNEPRVLINLFL